MFQDFNGFQWWFNGGLMAFNGGLMAFNGGLMGFYGGLIGSEKNNHLLMTNYRKSPFVIGKPSISMGHLYHGYVTNSQRVHHFFTDVTHDVTCKTRHSSIDD